MHSPSGPAVAYRSHLQYPAVNPNKEVQAIHESSSVAVRGELVLNKGFKVVYMDFR